MENSLNLNQNTFQILIKELGIENLSPQDQTEVILEIGRVIQQNIILRTLDELKEEDKNEFDKFLADENKMNDYEASWNFLRSKISNFDEIVNEEVAKFKKDSFHLLKTILSGK